MEQKSIRAHTAFPFQSTPIRKCPPESNLLALFVHYHK